MNLTSYKVVFVCFFKKVTMRDLNMKQKWTHDLCMLR